MSSRGLSPAMLERLRAIARGSHGAGGPAGERIDLALARRGLVIVERGGLWRAELTDAGRRELERLEADS